MTTATAHLPITHVPTCKAKPFLKWAGGKSQILNALIEHVPESYGKYIEPFVGGGAMFFALTPESAVISDSNEELINTYRVVQSDVENLIDQLISLPYSEEYYYELRSEDVSTLTQLERAVRCVYLNKTCFNGLYRVNKRGQFNVPFGRAKNPNYCAEEILRACSNALQTAIIECADYKDVLKRHAHRGDFIYIDPPYHPVSKYSDFKRYTKDVFYENDHIALRDTLLQLKEEGCHILASNSYCDFICDIYKDFTIQTVQAKRYINCIGSKRGTVNEVVIL